MEDKIFLVKEHDFEPLALEIFHFQYNSNPLYQSWINTLGVDTGLIKSINHIPFLPISFFKTHKVVSTAFEPIGFFESSGTTGSVNSRHYLKNMDIYRRSFTEGFELFYGKPEQYTIVGLLPSYLERKNSSLVVMVDELIKKSKKQASGFYLHDHDKLEQLLLELNDHNEPVLLIGVTFALLDFVANRNLQLRNTIVMETGGMKGRRKELTRDEVHAILKKGFGVNNIHSEYGMTELFSQAYARDAGLFATPPWMKILLRDEEDPLTIKNSTNTSTKGLLNIIDLANLYSCSFIATDDLGSTANNHYFTVHGRLDRSDLRGCSLLTI